MADITTVPSSQSTSLGLTNGNWGQFLNRLIEPSPEIVEPQIRRRVRLLSALLLSVIFLGLMGVIISNVIAPPADTETRTFLTVSTIVVMIVFFVSYLFSRTKRYMVGAVIVVVYEIFSVISAVSSIPETANPLLGYLLLSVLLGSILFSVRYTLYLIVACFISGITLPFLNPEIEFKNIVTILALNTILSGLIAVLVFLRERDIEQIDHQAQELAKAVEEAKLANQLKDEFLATMSHELRTPLNAIIGFSEVMMMGLTGTLEEKTVHTTNRIHYNSKRLLQLIDDLLDISKIESGRIELRIEAFKLRTLMDNLERTVKVKATEKSIDFVTTIDPALPESVTGDMHRIEQIAWNLATNAIKFTEKGGVTIAFRPKDTTHWLIEVRDTGIGIPIHAQDFIFDKFRQVDGTSRRAYAGVGLGLAIVRELTLLMGGTVNVQSKPNEGSLFTITLPITTIPKAGLR